MSIWQGFRVGWVSLGEGFRYLAGHRTLWPWALLPWLLQIGCLLLLATLGITYFDDLFRLVTPFLPILPVEPADTLWAALGWWLLWLGRRLLQIGLGLLLLLSLLFLTFVVGLLVAGPFNDLLAEQTEHLATGREEPTFCWAHCWRGLSRSLIVEGEKALLLIGLPIGGLPLALIPVVGAPLYGLLTGLFEMWAVGFACVDYPMSRRLWSFGARLSFARRHAVALTSFGALCWLPGALILCAPALVVGGTLLYVRLANYDRPAISG